MTNCISHSMYACRSFLKSLVIVVYLLVSTQQVSAQASKTDINSIRELAIAIQLGFEKVQIQFENMEKQRQADKEALDRRFESMDKRFESMDKRFESMDKRFESLEKRISFIETLMIAQLTAIFTLIASLGAYVIWTQNRERKLAQTQAGIQSISSEDFQQLLKRVQELEAQRAVT